MPFGSFEIFYGTTVPTTDIGKTGDLYYLLDSNGLLLQAYKFIGDTLPSAWTLFSDVNGLTTTYTPTIVSVVAGEITSTTIDHAFYNLNGNRVTVDVQFTITGSGGATGAMNVSLPFPATITTIGDGVSAGAGSIFDLGIQVFNTDMIVFKYDGTSPIVLNNTYVLHAVYFK